MPAPLSNDLRVRVIEGVENGETYEEVAARLCIGRASVSRVLRRWRETGKVDAKPTGGSVSPIDEDARAVLEWLVWSQPDATLERLVQLMHEETGIHTNDSTLSRVLAKMGLTRKKKRSSTTVASTRM